MLEMGGLLALASTNPEVRDLLAKVHAKKLNVETGSAQLPRPYCASTRDLCRKSDALMPENRR